MGSEVTALRRGLQSALDLIFDRYCLSCEAKVVSEEGLCGTCWRATPFIDGLVCDKCGTPLPGQDEGRAEYCDDCLTIARPWVRGRAAFLYKDNGRKLVLALKHGDRLELSRPLGGWLARAARPIVAPGMVVAPVPLHSSRLFTRRYNQAAELGRHVAKTLKLGFCPDLLVRVRSTGTQDGRDREGRFVNVAGALQLHPGRLDRIRGHRVLLVDDVMTSGATFAAAAEACHAAGAAGVSVLALARVAKDA